MILNCLCTLDINANDSNLKNLFLFNSRPHGSAGTAANPSSPLLQLRVDIPHTQQRAKGTRSLLHTLPN